MLLVIATKQPCLPLWLLGCFAALAMTNLFDYATPKVSLAKAVTVL